MLLNPYYFKIASGDINNKESEVYKRKQDDRVYHLLEYVGTKPNVFYHTKVRNIDKNKSI